MATQIASDNFNRANNSSAGMNLGANWTASVPEFDLGINSNQAYETVGGGNDNVAFWSANNFDNNHYSKVTLANASGSPYVIVRASATDYILAQFSSPNYKIYWYNGGSYTEIASGAGSIANGNTIELRVSGSTFQMYKNGSLVISGTNASTPSSGKPGIGIDDGATRLDDWSGGNMTNLLSILGVGS